MLDVFVYSLLLLQRKLDCWSMSQYWELLCGRRREELVGGMLAAWGRRREDAVRGVG